MINFEFCSPTKIYFGKNQETRVGEIIKEYGLKNVLLVYGQQSIFKSGLYDTITKSLKENEIVFFELGGVLPNPRIDLVRIGVNIAKENKIDLVLACGGGSVIDTAKAIACGAKVDFDPWLFNSHQEIPTQALKIATILTISAAGSELSNSCVISNPDFKIKNGFNSDIIRPLFSILNPELTYSVSQYQTSCGIVDILMHTLERYFNDVTNTYFTDEIALGLIKSTIFSGKIVINNPFDYEARASLMIASSFSHNGLTGLGTKMYFTVHKLEHILSGMHIDIAHGAGLSILFLAWAKYTKNLLIDKWLKLGEALGLNPLDPIDVINYFESFFKSLKMPVTLEEVSFYSYEFDEFVNRTTNFGKNKVVGIKNLDEEDVRNILILAK